MIHHLDNVLHHLFMTQMAELTDGVQVRFQPPDQDWRTYVADLTVDGQPANALNIYLAEPRENCKLRSNERVRSPDICKLSEILCPLTSMTQSRR